MGVVSLPLLRQEQASGRASTPCIGALHTSAGPIRLTVFREFKPIESRWCVLQEHGICAQAQTYAIAEAWFRLVSTAAGAEPAIVCGYTGFGDLQFVWPFEVRNTCGVRCLSWIGAEHANYNMGCYSPGFARDVSADDMSALLNYAAELIGVNAACFDKQPFEQNGVPNPMALLPHEQSVSDGREILLDQDFDTLYRNRFGGKFRNTLRRKERQLREEWDVKIGWAETPAEGHALLEELFRQKTRRRGVRGISGAFADESHKVFYHELAACPTGQPGALEISYIKTDDQYAAISCGIQFQDRFTILLTEVDDGPMRSCSPKTILQHRQIENACRKGLNFFDIGPGDVCEDNAWCDLNVPRFDSSIAFDEWGYVVTAQTALIANAKRFMKSRIASHPSS